MANGRIMISSPNVASCGHGPLSQFVEMSEEIHLPEVRENNPVYVVEQVI